MIREMKWAMLLLGLLIGNLAAFASFEGEDEKENAKKTVTISQENDEGEGDEDGEKKTGDNPSDSVTIDKDKVNVEDTLVYDDLITVEDTLVYEDFDTPKKDKEDPGQGQLNINDGDGDHSDEDHGGMVVTENYTPEQNHTGNSDDYTAPSINLYPNPVNSNSTIHLKLTGFSHGQITVTDLHGRCIHLSEINGEQSSLPGLSSGTYLVTASNESAIKTVRVIVR